jgi:hypothetical protein
MTTTMLERKSLENLKDSGLRGQVVIIGGVPAARNLPMRSGPTAARTRLTLSIKLKTIGSELEWLTKLRLGVYYLVR